MDNVPEDFRGSFTTQLPLCAFYATFRPLMDAGRLVESLLSNSAVPPAAFGPIASFICCADVQVVPEAAVAALITTLEIDITGSDDDDDNVEKVDEMKLFGDDVTIQSLREAFPVVDTPPRPAAKPAVGGAVAVDGQSRTVCPAELLCTHAPLRTITILRDEHGATFSDTEIAAVVATFACRLDTVTAWMGHYADEFLGHGGGAAVKCIVQVRLSEAQARQLAARCRPCIEVLVCNPRFQGPHVLSELISLQTPLLRQLTIYCPLRTTAWSGSLLKAAAAGLLPALAHIEVIDKAGESEPQWVSEFRESVHRNLAATAL